MAITYNASAIYTIQKSLYQLRQDVDLPTAATAATDTSSLWLKCKAAFETAVYEVAESFKWSTNLSTSDVSAWPEKCRNALVYCTARELAVPVAGRTGDMQNMDALYRDKLLQAKLTDLNNKLAANDDPVLVELLINFRVDDAGLVTAYSVYEQRSAMAKATAALEINAAQDWSESFNETKTTHPAYGAWVTLAAGKLAAACGMAADMVSIFKQEYAQKLQMAKVTDLEAQRAAVTGEDAVVLAEVLGDYTENNAKLPRSFKSVTDRLAMLKDNARLSVLAAHQWAFAERTYVYVGECVFDVRLPDEMIRIVGVYGPDGRERCEWRYADGEIHSEEPIGKVVFTVDVGDMDNWSLKAKEAYRKRLAADLALALGLDSATAWEGKAQLAIMSAKTNDTRNQNNPSDARGRRNFYVDEMMRGRRRNAPMEM